jgi:poly(ADP-ribose) glycohydrolase ARH3
MKNIVEKIKGMFFGIGLGDALGSKFENEPYSSMKDKKIEFSVGRTTDDTQLTLTIAEALIETGNINLDKVAENHVKEYCKTVAGWGSTTREAVLNLKNGVHWKESGNLTNKNGKVKGVGNGVAMKCAPLGAYFAMQGLNQSYLQDLANFSAMTHRTSVAISSCFAQCFAVYYCLKSSPDKFTKNGFINYVAKVSERGRVFCAETLQDDITDRIKLLDKVDENTSIQEIVDKFGGGSPYVYNSLPFSYAFFLRNPTSIDCMYECISAGGDTDSNASMIGALFGALNGIETLPDNLIQDLQEKSRIAKISDQFFERFSKKGLQLSFLK